MPLCFSPLTRSFRQRVQTRLGHRLPQRDHLLLRSRIRASGSPVFRTTCTILTRRCKLKPICRCKTSRRDEHGYAFTTTLISIPFRLSKWGVPSTSKNMSRLHKPWRWVTTRKSIRASSWPSTNQTTFNTNKISISKVNKAPSLQTFRSSRVLCIRVSRTSFFLSVSVWNCIFSCSFSPQPPRSGERSLVLKFFSVVIVACFIDFSFISLFLGQMSRWRYPT
ncbi:hypothetical protein BDP27DRAFT_1333754 [Rhodocollybia butyracea]|uniref:Transmembrane protein n=1 Tax=Rhodocollybia butyracea TaxID=206335 RepID=A0A9P5U385_9AGAR|nr:hypothetical protein BDP27DRAFT_1333754 [Rhodocollybia butyracea]